MTDEQIDKQQSILTLLTQIKIDLTSLKRKVKSVQVENEVESFFKLP